MRIQVLTLSTNSSRNNYTFKGNCLKMKANTDCFSFLDKYAEQRTGSKKLIQDLKNYISSQKGKIKESDITKVVGYGGLTTVFGLGNDKVLKCSEENPLEYRKHCAEFDIPFLSPVEKVGEHYFVIEPIAELENITVDDCKDVIQRIYASGYEPSQDLDKYKTRQVGRYNGKMYLLDTRAAVPQPDKFSQFIYDFCSSNKRVFMCNVSDDSKIEHIDESPRKNLKFIEGIKEAFDVVNTNIKYGTNSKIEGFGLKYYIIIESVIQKIKGIWD